MHMVTLPWPSKALHPNARVHWASKARATRKARHDAKVACLAAGVRGLDWPAAHVSLTFQPPSRRAHDLDNLLAALKGALDGVADATGIDDSKWTISIARGETVKYGSVVVQIEKGEG